MFIAQGLNDSSQQSVEGYEADLSFCRNQITIL